MAFDPTNAASQGLFSRKADDGHSGAGLPQGGHDKNAVIVRRGDDITVVIGNGSSCFSNGLEAPVGVKEAELVAARCHAAGDTQDALPGCISKPPSGKRIGYRSSVKDLGFD